MANQARDEYLENVDILKRHEWTATRINYVFIESMIFEIWNNLPMRYTNNRTVLVPDPSGSIHLKKYKLRFIPPNHIELSIYGVNEESWPDLPFEIKVSDTLSVQVKW